MHRNAKVLVLALVSVAAAAVLAACASGQPSSAASSADSPGSGSQQVSSSSSSGQEAVPAADGDVTISLDYNAGTGFEWFFTADPEGVVDLASVVTEDLADDETVTGGPLRDRYTFRAVAPGEVALTFELKRGWEEDAESADTQVYAFTVTDDLQMILNPYKSRFDNEPEQGARS